MWYQRRQTKYKNQSTEHNGIQYHSKKEAGYAAELDLRQKVGDIVSWERQVRIPLDVNGKHIADYFIDFVVHYPVSSRHTSEYVEVKGFETEVWRLKWKIFCALYENDPNIKLSVIK